MGIPKYLNIDDELTFSRWKHFAEFAASHASEYLNHDERELMILDLYQIERGYSEREEDFKTARKTYAPFLQQVLGKLGRIVLIKNQEYEWEKIVNKFGHRESGADFAEIIAHDLVLLERTNELYRDIKNKRKNLNEKFDNSLDTTAFKLARIIEEKDHENYMV